MHSSHQLRSDRKHTAPPTPYFLLAANNYCKDFARLREYMHMNLSKLHLNLIYPPLVANYSGNLFVKIALLRQGEGGRRQRSSWLLCNERTSEVTKSNVTTSLSSLLAQRLTLKRPIRPKTYQMLLTFVGKLLQTESKRASKISWQTMPWFCRAVAGFTNT